MSWHDILTDELARYYFFKQWYDGTEGIVEYLAKWVREYTTPEDAKVAGCAFVILICITIAVRTVDFMRKPAEGETIWEVLKNQFFNGKE